MATSLRRTISVSVNSLRERDRTYASSSFPSTTFLQWDVALGMNGNEEDDQTNSPVSPLQPFPSTASLHRAFLAHEVPVEMEEYSENQARPDIFVVESNIDHGGRELGFHDGNDESEDDDTNNIEIWNPWIPRLDEHIYPSESYTTLPNPYSPQPPFQHCSERDVESQSLMNLKGGSTTGEPEFSAMLLVPKDELRTEVSHEDASNGNVSNLPPRKMKLRKA